MEITMSNSFFTSVAPSRTARGGRQGFTRAMFVTIGAIAMLLTSTRPAKAQSPPPPPGAWEFYVSGGWLMPTGAQRATIKTADLTAVVVSYVPRPSFAITGTFEWGRSHDLAVVGEPKLDVFLCDVGAEARGTQMSLGGAWKVAPFVGIGGGAQSYNIPKLPVDPTYNLAAYGSVGGEFAIHRVHLRLEVRDNVSSFKPLAGGGKAATRNDVVVMLGLRFTKD
jgi:hypothetical protein